MPTTYTGYSDREVAILIKLDTECVREHKGRELSWSYRNQELQRVEWDLGYYTSLIANTTLKDETAVWNTYAKDFFSNIDSVKLECSTLK